MSQWIYAAAVILLLAIGGFAGDKIAASRYHAKIARIDKAWSDARDNAVKAQIELCAIQKQVTEKADYETHKNLDDLRMRYNDASRQLRAKNKGVATCLSVATAPGDTHAATDNGKSGQGKIDGGDILQLGYNADANGEVIRAWQKYTCDSFAQLHLPPPQGCTDLKEQP